ncbi:hypothetical protein HY256_01555, partial [Candidatus Sumerlaeota bacterium]|nr:hypothetical protein [Candidatus Sumerlaeota bacterium]
MEPVPSGSERRIAKRHKVDLSVMVEFVHPQSTIAPQTVKRPINETTGQLWYLHGGMTTLTEQGASVCITNISQQRYFRLIRDQT